MPRQSTIQKFRDIKQLMMAYSPDKQAVFASRAERCAGGTAPMLAEMAAKWGEGVPIAYIVPQIISLNNFVSTENKLTAQQVEELARVIYTAHPTLRTTDIMLFCFRFKAGKYGRLYGPLDPIFISAALETYCRERLEMIKVYEMERERERAEKESGQQKSTAISYAQWLEMRKKRASVSRQVDE